MLEPIAIPESVESEQALLGALLMRNEALFSLPADLNETHFHEPLHQRLFTAICEGARRGETVDAIVLKKRFDVDPDLADIGGGAYLVKLVCNATAVTNIAEYGRYLIDLAERRKIIAACQGAIMAASGVVGTSGEIASSLAAELDGSIGGYGRYRVSTEREATEALLESLKLDEVASYSTGLKKMDASMDGGMFAGKLYGIVARKKMGKTMLAGTISSNMQDSGVKHLYIALEMGRDEIHQRNMARRLNCFESAFRTGFAAAPHNLSELARYATKTENNRFYLDAPGLSFDDLRHVLPLYIRKYKISGYILDCWQLVKGKPKGQTTAEFLDDVAQWLAETCKKYKVFGLVTAQENQDENTRGGEGLRLACDQLYRLCKSDESSREAWLEMMETRYTKWQDVGSQMYPALELSHKFTHFEEC